MATQSKEGGYTIKECAERYPDLFKSAKSKNKKSLGSKRISVGCKATYCGHEVTVVGKHENKGWWTVRLANGKETSGDRKLIKVL